VRSPFPAAFQAQVGWRTVRFSPRNQDPNGFDAGRAR